MLPLGKLYIACQISYNEHSLDDVYRMALVTFSPQKLAWLHNIIIIIIVIIIKLIVAQTMEFSFSLVF
jgi:hypothetical protein